MRLHHLSLTAFGPFAGTVHIDFDHLTAGGIFLLHGPTGAGKTAILDAVCYALYGSVPGSRRNQLQALRSHHAAPRTSTEVTLDLTIAGRRLQLTRRPEQTRPKKRGTGCTTDKAVTLLSEHDPDTGTQHALSRSHQEVSHELGRLVGLNRDQFCQIVLLPQGDFARFLRAGADDRAHLLGRLFDTGRFAAAETHLAELRARAQQENRDDDARLLELIHRIQQAAGPAAAPQPPDAEEPALASAALTHAALARATAREHRDHAALAVSAAEAAHEQAQQHLNETTERVQLQRQHADARQRAAELAADTDRVAGIRALLDRSRAADAVAPTLELRDAAARELGAARTNEADARAALPRAFAEASADRLTAEDRAIRQQRGALEAARRAEERATRITKDLVHLDTEDRTDREHLTAIEERTAATESERTALSDRITATQDAAAQAETIATQYETAVQRLEAARRAETFTTRLEELDRQLLNRREEAATAYEHWLDTRELRLRSIAADLAATLRESMPCPVCGSVDHPEPARAAGDHTDHAAEAAAHTAHQQAEERRRGTEQQRADTAADLAAATARSESRTVHDLETETTALHAAHHEARVQADDCTAARADLDTVDARHAALQLEAAAIRERLAARASRRDVLDTERAALHVHPAVYANPGGAAADSTAARAAALDDLADLLIRAADAARTAEEAADRKKIADARMADAAYQAGFRTPDDVTAALLPAERRHSLQQQLDTHRADLTAVRERLADARTAEAARHPPADLEAARHAADAALRRLRDTTATETATRARCTDLDALSADLAAAVRRRSPRHAHRSRITRLAQLTAGTAAENRYRMRLETYVLAARLEQVAAAATTRLHRMTGGRYALTHSDSRSGRARSGLGLRVLDAWTGTDRDTATLSGGESFIVSLALALGLADTVTAEAGGHRLDTLFIDEGFGTLDEQSLDDVLDVLDGLRAHDRAVGIVSHVPELRTRIPVRLEVTRTRRGSAVHHDTAPLTP